jgi:hypothetical protein
MLTFTHSIGPDVRIRFSDKPDARIRSMLKANGFRWSPSAGLWWRRRIDGTADFLAALERIIGPRRPDGACWYCQSPEGFFRPHGAATPVYCDQCHAKRQSGDGPLGRDDGAYKELPADRFDLDHEDRCREACGL